MIRSNGARIALSLMELLLLLDGFVVVTFNLLLAFGFTLIVDS